MGLDLDAILAIADGYDAKMNLAREYFDRREPVPEEHKAYLATLADDEAVKAFEALRPLVARIRELERQRAWLAERLAFLCRTHDDCLFGCPNAMRKIDCPDVTFERWVEAAKEAGE